MLSAPEKNIKLKNFGEKMGKFESNNEYIPFGSKLNKLHKVLSHIKKIVLGLFSKKQLEFNVMK
ncbi:hypothetical protein CWR48_13295 [Oceanobacillus arenosus]|uniref:Uncharacterized protein n=1 Tax=Oceanobacillus arenosus TaxID=1229153 RepID=A0A3D8PRA5_9BACI|nr:hypothetical protein CWR48_13295 [Oceanobacillus arenosus]